MKLCVLKIPNLVDIAQAWKWRFYSLPCHRLVVLYWINPYLSLPHVPHLWKMIPSTLHGYYKYYIYGCPISEDLLRFLSCYLDLLKIVPPYIIVLLFFLLSFLSLMCHRKVCGPVSFWKYLLPFFPLVYSCLGYASRLSGSMIINVYENCLLKFYMLVIFLNLVCSECKT